MTFILFHVLPSYHQSHPQISTSSLPPPHIINLIHCTPYSRFTPDNCNGDSGCQEASDGEILPPSRGYLHGKHDAPHRCLKRRCNSTCRPNSHQVPQLLVVSVNPPVGNGLHLLLHPFAERVEQVGGGKEGQRLAHRYTPLPPCTHWLPMITATMDPA